MEHLALACLLNQGQDDPSIRLGDIRSIHPLVNEGSHPVQIRVVAEHSHTGQPHPVTSQGGVTIRSYPSIAIPPDLERRFGIVRQWWNRNSATTPRKSRQSRLDNPR